MAIPDTGALSMPDRLRRRQRSMYHYTIVQHYLELRTIEPIRFANNIDSTSLITSSRKAPIA